MASKTEHPPLDRDALKAAMDILLEQDSDLKPYFDKTGYPEPRISDAGYSALLRTIVGQQVSVAAAKSVWAKLEDKFGEGAPAKAVLAASDEELRACGLSRQKQGYARSLAELTENGVLDLANLPEDDEEAIKTLTAVKGIGRWSAEIYLLFALGRRDIFPAGDLAIQMAIAKIKGLDEKPSEKQSRIIAENWAPHRSTAALFIWHIYNNAAL